MTDPTEARVDGAGDDQLFGTGFSRNLGLVVTEESPQRTRGWAQIGPQHHQELGTVHGGWYAAVVETVASIGAYMAAARRGLTAVGVSNSTEFFRPHREGRLEIEALAVHQGRTQQVWDVRITRADDGELVARGHVRAQNVTPRV